MVMEAVAEDTSAHFDEDSRPSLEEPQKRPGFEKDLSHVSKHYDIGGKGFLTPAEQKARELDHKGEGNISNEQVVGLIERTQDLKKANKMLRRYMIALLIVTVVLGISQIATAIVAARLSKDTSVDSSTGLMTAKDSDKAVVVVSTGQPTAVVYLDPSGVKCVKREDFTNLFSNAMAGTTQNAVIRNPDGSLESLEFAASGTHSNDTHACLGGPGALCTTHVPCFPEVEEEEQSGGGRRLISWATCFHLYPHLFNRRARRALASEFNRNMERRLLGQHDDGAEPEKSPDRRLSLLGGGGGGGGGQPTEDDCRVYFGCETP